MRCVDLIAAFELEINKIDDTIQKPVTDDSLYWINQAVMKFVKDRFNGNAPKRTSYEQNEKRTRDLIKLFKEEKKETPEVISHVNYDEYEYDCEFDEEEDHHLYDNDRLIKDSEPEIPEECSEDFYYSFDSYLKVLATSTMSLVNDFTPEKAAGYIYIARNMKR